MSHNAALYHLLALLCTLFIEGAGIAVWACFAYPHPRRAISCALAVNLVVHTLFWYTQPLFTFAWPTGLYLAEFLVVLVEGLLYARFLKLPGYLPYLLSATLNIASFLAGLLLWQLLF